MSLRTTDRNGSPGTGPAGWLKASFGARSTVVVLLIGLLIVVAGGAIVVQVTTQMRNEADARLDGHVKSVASAEADLMKSASNDLRLARRNSVFEQALGDTSDQLLVADRADVEEAITYLGDRYDVDEICLIRANGLETARWVGGGGVAPVEDLSVDERENNPAVVPAVPLADDAVFETRPYVSPDSGRWVIGMATPVILASGLHAGVLHFEIPIARLAGQLEKSAFGGTAYNVLLNRDGELLVHPRLADFRAAANTAIDPETAPFPPAVAGGSAAWREAVARMQTGETGATTFEQDGQTYRVAFEPVTSSDRIVATVVPARELYADIDRALFNLAVTVLPLLALILLVSGWFTRRMARANSGLSGLNQRLAAANSRLEETGRSSSDLARQSAIVNQFTELTALTEDDVSLSQATLATLDELVSPDNAALHVSNQSQDRAVPQATLGEAEAQILSLHELGRCPAVRRSSLYVTDDLSSRLAYRCPVYPVETGTLACVPLVALGENVGAAHLHWASPRDLPLPLRLAVTRVSEHSALSIANRRLLLALRGQANTDGRTGLTNSRAFDEAVERRLAVRALEGKGRAAVLMLDLDHFKDFNDRYGHPAGDEALRVFASLLADSVREQDIAARYGGEEFAVYLAGLGEREAGEVAERIRERTESTIIPLGPGQTGRLTVSIGVAIVPEDGADRVMILKAADAALYQAKLAGRNRVVNRPGRPEPLEPAPARAARRAASRRPSQKVAAAD